MKIRHLIGLVVISFAAVGFISLAGNILAEEMSATSIQYPVKELDNCQDQAECRSYCDNSSNAEVCLDFAEKNNLMSEEDIQIAKNFLATGSEGPGGCTSKDSCEQYCNDMSHINECISFAEKNNLMPPAELEEAKKVQAAISRGVKPPACGNKKACDSYCEESEHMEECIAFGAEAGFIQGKDLEDAQKMLQAVRRGVKPPPCKGKEACDEYCSSPGNMEVCMNFAMEAGMMSEEEKADAQKMLAAVKQGINPPNCKGKEECADYCGQEDHFEECTNFAVAAGFMSAEDAEMARKTGGKGPGDCKGKEECEAFCNNPDNQETCFNFGRDNGLIPEEDLKQMEQGKQQLQQSLQGAPAELIDCLQSEVGQDMVEKMKAGTAMPSKDIGDKMQQCFQKMGPPSGSGGPGEGGEVMPPGGFNPDEGGDLPEGFPQGSFPEGMIPEGMSQEQIQQMMQQGQQIPQQFGPPPEGQQFGPSEGQQFGPPPEGDFQQPLPQEQGQLMPQGIQQPPAEMMAPVPQETPPPPPAEAPPQSILDKTQNFLGSIISSFKR